jgi:hypothetical protein
MVPAGGKPGFQSSAPLLSFLTDFENKPIPLFSLALIRNSRYFVFGEKRK